MGLENSIGTMPNLDITTTVDNLSSVSELLEATLAPDGIGSVLADLTSLPATLPEDSSGIIGETYSTYNIRYSLLGMGGEAWPKKCHKYLKKNQLYFNI